MFLTGAAVLALAACAAPDAEAPTPAEPAATPTPIPTVDVAATDLEDYAAALHAETNRVRAEEGLDPLEPDACAAAQARQRAEDLIGKELEHAPLAPVIAACEPNAKVAENLVDSDATPAAVVDAWLGSPGHRANLLAADVTKLGVACVEDDAQLLCAQIYLGP